MTRRPLRAALAAACAVLALVGCTSNQGNTGQQAGQAAGRQTTITVGIDVPFHPIFNYVSAESERYFADTPYDVTRLTAKPAPGQASIEAFFTRKGDAIYAVLPRWPGRRFVWKDAAPLRPKAVSLLGAAGALRFAKSGETIAIDLPDLPEELLGQPAWVLKLVR